MMRRDTYHDFVEMQELAEAGPEFASGFVQSRVDALAQRSGAASVSNGLLTVTFDASRMVNQYSVSFASRAWTSEELRI